jgi:hypothetical protein
MKRQAFESALIAMVSAACAAVVLLSELNLWHLVGLGQ